MIRASSSALLVRIVVPTTLAAVPVALWPHRRFMGIWVLFVGLAANLAVVLANGGLMPIERATVASAAGAPRADSYPTGAWIRGSKDVLVARATGNAVALGDRVIIPLGSDGMVASPGDIVIWAGLVVLGAEAALRWQLRGRRRPLPEEERRLSRARPPRAEGGAATPP